MGCSTQLFEQTVLESIKGCLRDVPPTRIFYGTHVRSCGARANTTSNLRTSWSISRRVAHHDTSPNALSPRTPYSRHMLSGWKWPDFKIIQWGRNVFHSPSEKNARERCRPTCHRRSGYAVMQWRAPTDCRRLRVAPRRPSCRVTVWPACPRLTTRDKWVEKARS